MAKRFSELGIKQQDDRKIFNCQQVSITDVLNSEIEVIDFIPGMKTQHGEGRYLIKFTQNGTEGKFFTNSSAIKSVLDQIPKEEFPVYNHNPLHQVWQREDIPIYVMKILHNNIEILNIQVDDSSYRYRAIKGDHNLTLYFSLAEHVEIPVGAYCVYENETYTLESPRA